MPEEYSHLLSPTFSSFLAELSQRADIASLGDISKKPLRLYINSARLLFRTAQLYRKTGDLPNSFVLFLKYSNLLVYGLSKHPEYKNEKAEIGRLKKDVLVAMDVLEYIKPQLQVWWEENVQPSINIIANTEPPVPIVDRLEPDKHDTIEEKASEDSSEKRRKAMEKFYGAHSEVKGSVSSDLRIEHSPSPLSVLSPLSPPPPPPPSSSKQSVEAIFLTESGMPLRRVNVPVCLIACFMNIAKVNTMKNIETCGVLCGILHHNQFTVTHLLIPKQTGTSDTVTMIKEEEVAEVAISKELMTLGWVHTHPTQSCFMSSVDQHTQFPFQALMAEAIAVVVAPTRTPNYGVFRLTDPPGMSVVGKCRKTGFHPHDLNNDDDRPMYIELVHVDCSRPQHVLMNTDLPIQVIDLR